MAFHICCAVMGFGLVTEILTKSITFNKEAHRRIFIVLLSFCLVFEKMEPEEFLLNSTNQNLSL